VRPDIFDGALQAALAASTDLDATAAALIAECNRRGGEDNMTLMLIVVE